MQLDYLIASEIATGTISIAWLYRNHKIRANREMENKIPQYVR